MSLCKELSADANKKYFWTFPFWKQGIRLQQSPDKNKGYMDESAVRARAGVIHIIVWTVLLCSFVIPQYAVIIYVGPFMFYDMMAGVLFGLTPFCPTGVIGTVIAWNIKPYYAPSSPKRLAWIMGAAMAALCTVLRIVIGPHIAIRSLVLVCILLTFLESSLGFCVGCYFYTKIKNSKRDAISPKHGRTENMDEDEDRGSELVSIKNNDNDNDDTQSSNNDTATYGTESVEIDMCTINEEGNICGQ